MVAAFSSSVTFDQKKPFDTQDYKTVRDPTGAADGVGWIAAEWKDISLHCHVVDFF